MAQIEQRGDTFRITVFIGRDENNKRMFEKTTFKPLATSPAKARKEVEAFALDFEQRIKEGKFRSGEKITFGEFVDTWETEWADKNITQSVKEAYRSCLDRLVIPSLKNIPIGTIRVGKIQPILDEYAKDHTVPSVKKLLAAINSVFRFAFHMDVIQDNPCLRCTVPKMQKKTYQDIHYFTIDQAKIFLNALDKDYSHQYGERTRTDSQGNEYKVAPYTSTVPVHHQWKSYFYLAIYGGFRRGEIIALNWSDIDFKNNIVSINKAVARTKESGQIMKGTKTVSGIRDIVLPKMCFDILKAWKKEQMRLCMKLGSAWEGERGKEYDNNPVFIQIDSGKRMDVSSPTHKFKEILRYYNDSCEDESMKLPDIRLHDLRHTAITQLLANGGDIETASHRHGHSNASVTMDVYGHWTEENDKKAADLLESLFAN